MSRGERDSCATTSLVADRAHRWMCGQVETALPSPPRARALHLGPVPSPFDPAAFRHELTERTAAAVSALRARIGTETSTRSRSTRAGRRASPGFGPRPTPRRGWRGARRRMRGGGPPLPRRGGAAAPALVRAADWACHDFAPEVRALALPDPAARTPAQDEAIYGALVGALRSLDRAGDFGRGADRVLPHA